MSTRKPKTPSKRTRGRGARAANINIDVRGLSSAEVYRGLHEAAALIGERAPKITPLEGEAKADAGDVYDELRRVAGELYDLAEDLAIELDDAKDLLVCNWVELPGVGSFVRRRQRILTIADQVLERHQTAVARTFNAINRDAGVRFRCWEFDAAADAHDVHQEGC